MNNTILELTLQAALITLGLQIVFFAYAAFFKTDKVTDLSYGLTFVLVAGYIYYLLSGNNPNWAQVWVYPAVILWGARLAGYLFRRILAMGKDDRFDGRREDFWSFASFWGLQASAIFLICLPLYFYPELKEGMAPTGWDFAGIALFLVGFLTEWVADSQKFRFRQAKENRGVYMHTGLWSISRHPNYLGEILLWWGIWIPLIPTLSGWSWITLLGPLFITLLLLKVSGIPLLEKSSYEKYGSLPDYRTYCENTPILIPLIGRKGIPDYVRADKE